MDAHSDHTYYRCEEEREDGKNFFPSQSEWSLEVPLCTELMHLLSQALRKKHYSCKDWRTFMCRHISRWKDMIALQYANVQYPWKDMKNFSSGTDPGTF